MSPAMKLPLPTGKLGVVFLGKPPVVARVLDSSPLRGKVKAGFVFEALTLSDGTRFEGLSAHDLVEILNDHAEEPGRKIQLRLGMPSSVEVPCPSGELGIKLVDIDGKPTVTKVAIDSPLKKDIRAGLCVDKLTLEDGMIIEGHSAEEFTEFLIDDIKSSGRVLRFVNTEGKFSARSVTLPMYKAVDLPAGKLGVGFKGKDFTFVSTIRKDSSLRGAIRSGMVVDHLTMPDGTEFRGLNPHDLSEALKISMDSEGRQMILKSPKADDLPTFSSTKVFLPSLGNARELGLTFVSSPATISEVAESSPIFGKARRGQQVLSIGWSDGTEYDDLDANELEDVIEDSSGSDGRYLILNNLPAPPPEELIIPLPTGKIGLTFKGTPPVVMKILPESPLLDSGLKPGMVADTLTLENGEVFYEMTPHELTVNLLNNADSQGRVLRFIDPTILSLSTAPTLPKSDELEIILPAGKLSDVFKGVMFKGDAPCVVSEVAKNSPLRAVLPVGMAVDSLIVGKLTYVDMDANTLSGYLSNSSLIEGRVLKLKDPDVEGVEFQKNPDMKEVVLPPGKLGVTVKGTPPMPTKYTEDSSVCGLFPTGMFIDMITMSDGTIMTGLSTPELVAILKDSSDETERTLIFKNPKTREPSAPGIILPDEKKIQLPVGKLGVFFKGKELARVSRLNEDSPVRNLIRVGMVVDVLSIPGGKTYSGLTAKEVSRVLYDTVDIEGRTMVLKNPLTCELSPRNISSGDDESVITEAEDGADDISQMG